MSLTIIAACSAVGRVIGNQGQLPWKQRADMKRFKERTTDKIVLMGRKTYESIGKLLPNRYNIIFTRKTFEEYQGKIVGTSEFTITEEMDNIFDRVSDSADEEVFVIGGAEIYAAAMNKATRIDLTEVYCDVVGDAFFPRIDPLLWTETSRVFHSKDENNQYDYAFVTYEKR